MKNQILPFTSHTSSTIINDFLICLRSRLVSNQLRREALNGRAKFGIEGGGKELPQACLAHFVKEGDYFSPYYRDQTFMLAKDICTAKDLFAALYGDREHDKFSGGRQMNNHFATPFVDEQSNWIDQTKQYNIASGLAPLGGNIGHALGLALASKLYKQNPDQTDAPLFSSQGDEISICTVGDATTSEGVFFEALNAAGVMQVPLVLIIYDDGHGISVPTRYQTTKESISSILEGFRMNEEGEGVFLYTAKAWDYEELLQVFEEGIGKVRASFKPAVFHITECTQPNGHSSSGSHTRYKSQDRLKWEKEVDGIRRFKQWILDQEHASLEELQALEKQVKVEVRESLTASWQAFIEPAQHQLQELKEVCLFIRQQAGNHPEILTHLSRLDNFSEPGTADLLKFASQLLMLCKGIVEIDDTYLNSWYNENYEAINSEYRSNLYSEGAHSPMRIQARPPQYERDAMLVNGSEVLKANFDSLFQKYDNLYAFGEDVGKIGGVNQALSGLQEKYGEHRIFDTGIREWTIAAQAIGMAMRGLRPIAEIQYLDYIHYAISPLADDLATLRYRSNGMQKAPVIIRTRGHRLEGIWHSGSPIAMLLHSLRGMHVLVPRNMTQAAGMYNTLLEGDDPALLIEVLNGYRQKEYLPDNLGEFTVALGEPEILLSGKDITLITYGACVRVAQEACEMLSKKGIEVELIDVQSLLPFDIHHTILQSLKKTNRIIFMDEDVPGGTTAYMMQEVLEKQGGYRYLDSAPRTLTASATRPPYGDEGNYYSKPQVMDVFTLVMEIMEESDPTRFTGRPNLTPIHSMN